MKVRFILLGLLIILGSIITGLSIAALRITSVQHNSAFASYGSWKGTTNLQLNKNDLVTTQVTLFALFALPSYEAVYLFASNDDKNEVLNGNSAYTIEGNIHDIKANYWSITAYGKDLYLMKNNENRFSFNNNSVITDSNGNFKIVVSADRIKVPSGDLGAGTANWLPVTRNSKFRLVLRIYQGEKDFMDHLDKAHLPIIKKIGA
ncbi:MAG: hypothetical protein JWO06_3785 [Bacteroidota bacterium]|nr:hypothetical protein [Bacteroidota bacterium]